MSIEWKPQKLNRQYIQIPTWIMTEDKDNREPGIWSKLSKSAQAVFPVIARYINKNSQISHPSESLITMKAGLKNRKTVRKATRELQEFGIISIAYRKQPNGHRRKEYTLKPQPQHDVPVQRQLSFPFAHLHIDGGNWAVLTPSAKSLAMVLLSFNYLRPDLDPEYEGTIDRDIGGSSHIEDEAEYQDYLRKHNVKYCSLNQADLVRLSGIDRASFKRAIESLRQSPFIAEPKKQVKGHMVSIFAVNWYEANSLNECYPPPKY